MKNINDLRVKKTRRSICTAFISLQDERGIDALTIRDITDRAGVNRSTFYAHFHDLFDLREQLETEVLRDLHLIISHWRKRIHEDGAEQANVMQHIEMMTDIFTYIGKNAMLLKSILGPQGDSRFWEKLKEEIIRHLYGRELTYGNGQGADVVLPEQYVAAYVVSANLGLIQEWLHRDCAESPREIALIHNRLSGYNRQ